jgi:hypothetical protein
LSKEKRESYPVTSLVVKPENKESKGIVAIRSIRNLFFRYKIAIYLGSVISVPVASSVMVVRK